MMVMLSDDNNESQEYTSFEDIEPASLVRPVTLSLEHMIKSGYLDNYARIWGSLFLEELNGTANGSGEGSGEDGERGS